jgi:ketosteroid isomerase-like protein
MIRNLQRAALLLLTVAAAAPAGAQVTDQLDAYWAELARTVAEGSYEAYAAAYHADAVLVSLGGGRSYPIAEALAGWKQGFDDTRAGTLTAGVEFRFSRRLTGPTTAHETGIFRYVSQRPGQEPEVALIHFTALLVKRDGAWKLVMEHQKEPATVAEWDALRGPDSG